jgi:transposase
MAEELQNIRELDVDSLPDSPVILKQIIKVLIQRIIQLEDRVQELEDKLSKYSRNSSKPPSSDGYSKKPTEKKTSSLREKSGRKAGGQAGHAGNRLEKVENADRRVLHEVEKCSSCGHDLSGIKAIGEETRQVFDIPVIRIEVTEHKVEKKKCPCCGKEIRADFPAGVTEEVQYGERIQAWAIYLQQFHYIPYDRTTEIIESTFGHKISAGTLYNFNEKCYAGLAKIEEIIKEGLRKAKVLHVDESGMDVGSQLNWIHVASNENLTHYGIHEKRGKEAMDEIGILPYFQGTLIHDYWKAYYNYFCKHALCNAHQLRELKFLNERHNQEWAKELITLLVIYKDVGDFYRNKDEQIPLKYVRDFESSYDKVVQKGLDANPKLIEEKENKGKRGRKKRTLEQNMLNRLKERRKEILRYMHDLSIPFDNNQAERDIRMVKLKQKISGCFRSRLGAKIFCRIRSYLSTCRKQNVNLLQALEDAIIGKPFIPQTI